MVNQIEKTDDIVTLDSIKRKFVSRCSMNHNKNQNEIKDWTSEDDNASEKECKIPLDYELLPEEFFLYKEIPFPLVSKSWLKSLKQKLKAEDEKIILAEESEDDSIPLAKLKEKLNKNNFEINCNLQRANDSFNVYDLNVSNRTLPNVKVESSSVVENSPKKKIGEKQSLTLLKKTDDTILVSRKRGRPRKPEQISDVKNEFPYDFFECSNDSDSKEDVWKDSEGSFNFNFHEQGKPADELKEKIDIKSGINCKKHDYFKSREIANKKHENDDQESVKNKKKEENDVVGGKAENAKIAYLCFECGKSFSAASTLKNHKRIHDGTLLKCTECYKGFTTKYLLKCHMRIHSGDLFMCHKCDKGFTTAELLKVHSRGHTGDRPFVCNICERSFPSASNLSQHKQIHNSEKKFLCFQCGSSFSQKRCLDGHMLIHAEKNHICNVCGKLWARKSDLIEHMRVHTGLKPYSCNICPQKFTQASSLKRHQIVHMDIKPIQCLTCNKMFKCQEYYKRHVRKHEKEIDYLSENTSKNN